MSLITRTSKGSKLTIAEMDGNLTYLDSKVATGGGLVDSDLNGIRTAIGSSSTLESLIYTAGLTNKGSDTIISTGLYENVFTPTIKTFQYFNLSLLRWSGVAPIYVYIHTGTGTAFTLVSTITPLDVSSVQTFTVNVAVPIGSKIALAGNIGYNSSGGIGVNSYDKATFVFGSLLPAFELPYKVEFVNAATTLQSVASQISDAKVSILGGSTKTLNTVDTALTGLKNSIGTAIETSLETLAPSGALSAGSSTTAGTIWENQWAATTKAYTYFNLSFVRNLGVAPIYVYIHTASTFTLVSTITPLDVATVQTFKIAVAVPIGSNIAITGNVGYNSSGGIGLARYNSTTFVAGTLLSGFELMYKVDFALETSVVVTNKKLTLKNSDKVMFIGNSYTEGGWSLRMKHYTNNISMLSDFNVIGYGNGAYTLQQIYDDLTADVSKQSWANPSKMDITYAVIALETNNTGTGAEYFAVLVKLCDKLESMGIQPILATEHYSLYSLVGLYHAALADLAKLRNYPFINWGNYAQNTQVLGFDPFRYPAANHLGTRTYWAWVEGMMPYLSQIVTRKGIKLFKQRSGTDFTTLPVYSDNFERAKSFEELELGTRAYTVADEKNFDRANHPITVGGSYVGTTNDYANITNLQPVTFGTYALLSLTLDYWNVSTATLTTVSTGVTNCYIKKHDGTWQEITFSSALSLTPYIGINDGRQITLLLKGTALTITDIKVDYQGRNEVALKSIVKPNRITTNSLFSEFMSSGNWTAGSGVTNYTPVVDPTNSSMIEPYPTGVTVVKELNTIGKYVTTTFSLSGAATDEKELQLRILCRNFPAFIDTDAKFATSKITTGSYDLAKIYVTVTSGTYTYKFTRYVGLWWKEILIDFPTPCGTSMTIKVESADDNNLQIASVGAYY